MRKPPTAEAVDGAYFATLGIARRAAGRMINRRMMRRAHGWRCSAMSSGAAASPRDPNVVGREIRINGQMFEVVGVARRATEACSARFRSTSCGFHVATESLLRNDAAADPPTPRERQRLLVFGRLAAGRTIAEASAEWPR